MNEWRTVAVFVIEPIVSSPTFTEHSHAAGLDLQLLSAVQPRSPEAQIHLRLA